MPQKIEFKSAKFEQHEMDLHVTLTRHKCAYDEKNRNWICFLKSGRYIPPNCSRERISPIILKLAIYYVDDFGDINAVVDGVPHRIFGDIKNIENTNKSRILNGITEYESMEQTTILINNTLYDCYGGIIVGDVFGFDLVYNTQILCRTGRFMILYGLNGNMSNREWELYTHINAYVLDLINRKLVMKITDSKIPSMIHNPDPPSIALTKMNQSLNRKFRGKIEKLFEIVSDDTFTYMHFIITVGNMVGKTCDGCKEEYIAYTYSLNEGIVLCMDCFGQSKKREHLAFIYG